MQVEGEIGAVGSILANAQNMRWTDWVILAAHAIAAGVAAYSVSRNIPDAIGAAIVAAGIAAGNHFRSSPADRGVSRPSTPPSPGTHQEQL